MFHMSGSKADAFAKSAKCADNSAICFQGYSAQFAFGTSVLFWKNEKSIVEQCLE